MNTHTHLWDNSYNGFIKLKAAIIVGVILKTIICICQLTWHSKHLTQFKRFVQYTPVWKRRRYGALYVYTHFYIILVCILNGILPLLIVDLYGILQT